MVSRFALLALVLVLAACGKPFTPVEGTSAELTGARNANGTPYTGASGSSDLEILKQQIDPSSKENLDFAASVKSVSIVRQDLAGNTVLASPAKLEIRISLGGKVSLFSSVLNSSHDASSVTSKDSDVRLNVHCLDADCAAVEVRLSHSTAEAGFIYRVRSVSVDVLGPFTNGGPTTSLDHIASVVAAEKSPLLTTVEVAWGPAMFSLGLADLSASGDLVATGGEEENVAVVSKEHSVKGRLVGNSNRGDLLLRVSDGDAWVFVRINLSAGDAGSVPDVPDDSGPVVPDTTAASDRYIPYDLANPLTAVWQRDRMKEPVLAEIANMSSGSRSTDMKKFLAHLRPNLPAVMDDLKTQDLPPEMAFIMFVESSYFYSNPLFKLSVSEAGAVGPWQFMPGTGEGLGLKVFPTTASKDAKGRVHYSTNSCDERNDFHKSTLAAAKYLRSLLKAFKHDPKLAVMAYNMGGSLMNKRMKVAAQQQCEMYSICAYDMAKLDFWYLYKMKVGKPESRNYVVRFLAAQFVGRAPSASGVSYDTTFTQLAPSLPASCR